MRRRAVERWIDALSPAIIALPSEVVVLVDADDGPGALSLMAADGTPLRLFEGQIFGSLVGSTASQIAHRRP